MNKILMTGLLLLGLSGCTSNEISRQLGGSQTLFVSCNQKVVNVTWKEVDLWYVTRPMRDDEQAEVFTFQEKSSYGLMEGRIVLQECKK